MERARVAVNYSSDGEGAERVAQAIIDNSLNRIRSIFRLHPRIKVWPRWVKYSELRH
jgi:hypothetical protein